MPGMDEIFGRNVNRPDHPDFWRISEIILAADGAIEAARSNEEREAVFKKRTGAVVNLPSVMYAASQRTMRAFGTPGAGAAFGLSGRDTGGLSIEQQSAAAALWVEAFVYGAKFAEAGGHQE